MTYYVRIEFLDSAQTTWDEYPNKNAAYNAWLSATAKYANCPRVRVSLYSPWFIREYVYEV